MNIYDAVNILRRGLNDCSYEFTSTSYQDRCEGISVSSSGNTIYVSIKMRLADPYYKEEVESNIVSTLNSLRYQYEIPYQISYEIHYR